MMTLEEKMDTLCNLLLSMDEREIRQKLRTRLRGYTDPQGTETITRAILLELGAPDHLVGHPYVIYALELLVKDPGYINCITRSLYPKVAERFDVTPARVERAIRHLVEVTWSRGDLDVLMAYFGNTISASRGKPTNGEFLARIANEVRRMMKQ